MRPLVSNPNVHIPQKSEQLVQDQPTRAAPHRLVDVRMEVPPYRAAAIETYLQKSGVRRRNEAIFDDCIFQSVLFNHLFAEAEAGQPVDRLPVEYLLKKSVELLQPLGEKIEATCSRYDDMLVNAPPVLRERLGKELKFVQGMVARFQTLESDLLGALSHPEDLGPTRDKACFLLFAHAMLSDAANEVQLWMDEKYGLLTDGPAGAEGLVRSYLIRDAPTSNLFSSGPLTPADKMLYKKCLATSRAPVELESYPVPSFSRTGSQGVLAILHCIFQGKCLLSGAIQKPHGVHDNFFEQQHVATLRHDATHGAILVKQGLFSVVVPKLMPIYLKLENPKGNPADQDVNRDLFVLFYLVHENPMLLAPVNPQSSTNFEKSFLDRAREFFGTDFFVLDTIPVLNKVGFSIAPINVNSSPEEKKACYEAVALAMDSLWKEFRVRHREDLVASGLFAKLPNFLTD